MSNERSTSASLIEATIDSIHCFGLAATTVKTVTELAGLSRGMVRYEFASKQAMLVCVLESLCAEWTAATEPDPGLAGGDQVESIVRAMFAVDVFTDARVDTWLALSIAATSTEALRPSRERAYASWGLQLRTALKKAGVEDPDVVADGILGAADGLWLRHRLEPTAMARDHAERVVLTIARAALPERRLPLSEPVDG